MNFYLNQLENLLLQNNICLPTKKNQLVNEGSIVRSGFYLTENIGNNSFAYSLGVKIYVPPVNLGSFTNIKLGKKVVFRDYIDKNIQSSVGLSAYILGRSFKSQTPIFICDNHNQVLEAWHLFKDQNNILIHIDQHKDENQFIGNKENWLKNSKIADYISLAKQMKWIENEHYSFTESKDLLFLSSIINNIKTANSYSIILNIDLDFFAPEFNLISLDHKINLIKAFIPYAKLITLATSPLFINQSRAISIAKLFWQYL